MNGWIPIEDELPPIVESHQGVNYHGVVVGWFPYFYRMHGRDATLWTTKDGVQRWIVTCGSGQGESKEPPTHRQHKLRGPNNE